MPIQKIRILHLEDSETDAAHIHRVLKKGGINFTSLIVDARVDYVLALKEFEPDIVISDHSLPAFNSLQALDILRSSGLDIPFVLVTGAVSEEFAADIIMKGADDYILKDRPQRLPVSILNALEKYKLKHARETSESHLRNFFKGSLDILCNIDAEGRFVEVSAASEKIWGYQPDELVGKKYADLIYKADHAATRQIAHDIMAGLTVTNFENHYIHRNGNLVPMIWSARWDADTQIMYAVARDGTEKVKAEKAILTERKRLLELFTNAPVNMCMFIGKDHVFEMVNKASERQMNRDVIGKKFKDVFPELEQQGFTKLLDKVYKTGQLFEAKEMLVKVGQNKDNTLVDGYLNVLLQPYHDADGHIEGVCYFGVHVTEQVLARRKIEEGYEKLKSAEALQSSILNSLPAQVALLDSAGKIIAVNQTWKSFAKENNINTPQQGVGENYIGVSATVNCSDTETGIKMADGISEVIRGNKKAFSMEYRCDAPTEKRWFLARVAPTQHGDEIGAVIIHTNITDRKLAEEKIEKSEANLAAIIENADAHIYSLDREFRYITFNSAIKKFMKANFGLDIKPGDNAYDFLEKIDPAEAKWWQQIYTEALADQNVRFVKDYSRPGIPNYLNFSINPILENGSIIGLSCFARDITEKKLSEIEMAQLNNRLLLATTSAGMGIWDWDIPKNKLTWDEGMFKLYGIERGQFASGYSAWINMLHPEDKQSSHNNLQQAIEGKAQYDSEFRIVCSDLSIRYIKATGTIERDPLGTAVRMIGANWDITPSKEAELAVQKMNETLEQRVQERTAALSDANKELEAFTGTVSHDLRAPARAIAKFAEIIRTDYGNKMEPKEKQLFHFIEESGNRMTAIIEDLLKLARYGNEQLKLEAVDMTRLVQGIWLNISRIESHHAKLELQHLGTVKVDMSMIQQVVVNLLSNAIKYSSKKEKPVVTVWCERNQGQVTFYFKDNGAGFDMKNYSRLFGVFQRFHNVREFAGTGVGLSLVKRIIEKHNGTVGAEAKVDEGATFYFTLPVE